MQPKSTTDNDKQDNSGQTVVNTTTDEQRGTVVETTYHSTPEVEQPITEVNREPLDSPPEVNRDNQAVGDSRNTRTRIGGDIKLTRKQRAYADYLLSHPKESGTQAALNTYATDDPVTAASIHSENLRKPQVMAYLDIHAQQAQDTVLTVMEYSKQLGRTGDKGGAAYAAVSVSAARDILDRIHGKATQRTEVSTKAVSVNINLSL